MSNDFYNPTGNPGFRSTGVSQVMRDEYSLIGSAFDKMPALTDNAGKVVKVNDAGNALTVGHASELKYAQSDQAIASSTTFTDDSYLAGFTLTAGGVYRVDGILLFETTDTDPDVKLMFQASEDPVLHAVRVLYSDASGGGTPDSVVIGEGATSERLELFANARNAMLISGIIQANALNNGTWTLRWAQYASNVNAVTRKLGSFIELLRVV